MTGTLYLIPTPLSDCNLDWIIPIAVKRSIQQLRFFIVEQPKTARRFLKQIECNYPLQDIHMGILNEHTRTNELETLMQPLLAGHDMGLLSEAGCPAIADPGSNLVRLAHHKQIKIIPLTGPSSILLALMASGLNGQRFCFHGYLPIDRNARTQTITALEKQSGKQDQTQIFIETPYRNQNLFELLVKTCRDDTDLCLAMQLTSVEERVTTRSIKQWKSKQPDFQKIPTIFLLHANR
ncbi:SAM-dependent methyltransferase [Nitrosomonas marina]|nr:SAM-dependent methyltransferase [Nitrosomonas marina]